MAFVMGKFHLFSGGFILLNLSCGMILNGNKTNKKQKSHDSNLENNIYNYAFEIYASLNKINFIWLKIERIGTT